MTREELIARLNAQHTAGDPLRDAVLDLIQSEAEAVVRAAERLDALTRTEIAEHECAAKLAATRRCLVGQRESFERTRPLCSDHVDKMAGRGCLGCALDRAEAKLAEALNLAEKIELQRQTAEAKLAEHEARLTAACEITGAARTTLPHTCQGTATCEACGEFAANLVAAESREKALATGNKALREALRAFQHGGDFEPDDRAVVVARAALAAGEETP